MVLLVTHGMTCSSVTALSFLVSKMQLTVPSSLYCLGMECLNTCKTLGTGRACVRAKLLQSCLTLGNHMDCSLLGSSVHGILQARILEWVAISFSRGSL